VQNNKISLVIPAYNEQDYIGECLKSVLENGKDLFEIIVVNNASTDKTVAVAETFSNVKVINATKKGLTKARQKGLEEARGNIIAYNDADTKMPEDWVKKVAKYFEEDERVVCVSGPYIYYDQSFISKIFTWVYWLFLAYPSYFFIGYMAVGGNFAVKKSAIEKIGGFDENISFYGEDTDMARRLSKIGKVKFIPSLYMYTSARRLKGEGLVKMAIKYIINFASEVLFKKPAIDEYKDIR
jgi:cellulose synthase/poly-beta-1,6-N-acetylglucosamine synthase-like glycosyltransferase